MHDEADKNQPLGRWQLKGTQAIIAALEAYEAPASCDRLHDTVPDQLNAITGPL